MSDNSSFSTPNYSLTTGRPIEIMLVEDNPGDVRLIVEAFKENKLRNKLDVVEDDMEAMAFLRQEDKYADVPRPDLIRGFLVDHRETAAESCER